jgi:hypothetical protein
MEDFPFEAVFYSVIILSGWAGTWWKYREEMKRRHALERDLQDCEQDRFFLEETIKKAGHTVNVDGMTGQARDRPTGHGDDNFTLP